MSTPPLSSCRRAGDLLFLSGQLGVIDGAIIEGGAEAETRQAIRNIEAVLAEHGATLESIVKNTVYLSSLSDWPAMNKVYAEIFEGPYPARSAVGAELVFGALVEIESIAFVPERR